MIDQKISRRDACICAAIGFAGLSLTLPNQMVFAQTQQTANLARFVELSSFATGMDDLDEQVGRSIFDHLKSANGHTLDLFLASFEGVSSSNEFVAKETSSDEAVRTLIEDMLKIWFLGWTTAVPTVSADQRSHAYVQALAWRANGTNAKGLPQNTLWNE